MYGVAVGSGVLELEHAAKDSTLTKIDSPIGNQALTVSRLFVTEINSVTL